MCLILYTVYVSMYIDHSVTPSKLRAAEDRHWDKRKVQGFGKFAILWYNYSLWNECTMVIVAWIINYVRPDHAALYWYYLRKRIIFVDGKIIWSFNRRSVRYTHVVYHTLFERKRKKHIPSNAVFLFGA